MSPGGDKHIRGFEPPWVAAVLVVVLAFVALLLQLIDAVDDAGAGPDFPWDYAARFEGLWEHLPVEGPEVEPYEDYDIAIVGYWSYPELINATFMAARDNPELRRRIDEQFLLYNLTVHAMAPRIVVFPDNPLFQRVRFIVGNFARGEDVLPPGPGLELVAAPGNGTALWRRP